MADTGQVSGGITGKDRAAGGLGRPNFLARTGLDTAGHKAGLAEIVARITAENIDVVRIVFVDTQGLTRVRPIEARHFASAARNGVPFTTALFAMDSANNIFQNVFAKDGGFGRETMGGAGDMLAVPDLASFRVLPWAPRTGWVLSDLYLSDGAPCPFDPRRVMRSACAALAARGLTFIGGVEVECHVLKLVDGRNGLADCTQPPAAPEVAALRHGYQHLSEYALDDLLPVINPIRQALIDFGLPLRTLEIEWGPGQLEVTLDPLEGLAAADAMIMLRTAVKQVARRQGLIASFMTKPGLPNVFSSGWHLHQSLAHAADGSNGFTAPDAMLSQMGLQFVGGLLDHVRAATAFSNPTINGYKRLNANPLAPKRAVWAHDNKAAMLRLIGGPGDSATHIENRSGEPAANPYLYMASQIFAGLDGMDTAADPGPPLDDPYAQVSKPLLPTSLAEAVDALDASTLYRRVFGDEVVSHFVAMKRHEIGRFNAYVTDWEHREYFETF
jgi:glutamine synthetase